VIIVVGLIVAFLLIVIFANRRTRNCRWREDRTIQSDKGRRYKCMACGAEAFTTTGKPPLDCKANPPPR